MNKQWMIPLLALSPFFPLGADVVFDVFTNIAQSKTEYMIVFSPPNPQGFLNASMSNSLPPLSTSAGNLGVTSIKHGGYETPVQQGTSINQAIVGPVAPVSSQSFTGSTTNNKGSASDSTPASTGSDDSSSTKSQGDSTYNWVN